MNIIGRDTDGITQHSLSALEMYTNHILKKILIEKVSFGYKTYFIFEGDDAYEASGFSIGYGGEGPNGLHKAIQMFCPEKIDSNFWNTQISFLKGEKYEWNPENGFRDINT